MFKRLMRSPAVRRRTSWVIAFVLLVPFILFFHASGRVPVKGPGGTAGIIFGKRIPWETFQEHRLWIRHRLEAQLGNRVPENLLGALLTSAAWDRLILLEEASRRRFRVDDRELASFIQGMAEFQEDGRFLPDRYHRILLAVGMNPQSFEERLRDDLRIQQLVTSIRASVSVTDDDVRAAYREAHETLKACVILMDPTAWTQSVSATLTEDELRERYTASPDEVRMPEQLVIEYAGASRQSLAESLRLSEQDVKTFYEDHRDRFATSDGAMPPFEAVQEEVRQALNDERVQKRLSDLALDLQDDVEAKRPFPEILAARALAPRTVGPVRVDTLEAVEGLDPTAFQDVAALREGEMSGVLQTSGGVYLARVTQRIPAKLPPFEEVREQIKGRLIQERARSAARQASEALLTKLKEQRVAGLRFEEAVLIDDAPLTYPSPFTRSQPIDAIGRVPALNEAAFRAPLGGLTDVIETPRGFVMLRPEERIPADESNVAEAQSAIREELLTKHQATRLDEWLNELRSRAKLQNFTNAPPAESGT
ncbi:MAG: peptidyl-prolyl cis-trans isomerase [Candidatus Omnitrophica bacterium]|nr:peptidyl-prolyl cis-trans isomerase [Candidatus Omnitrophota bacterium]